MRAVVPLERSHQLEGQTPVHVSHPRDNTSLLRLIALLLFLLVAASIYNIVTTYQQNQLAEQRAATYRERVAAVSKVAEEWLNGSPMCSSSMIASTASRASTSAASWSVR